MENCACMGGVRKRDSEMERVWAGTAAAAG